MQTENILLDNNKIHFASHFFPQQNFGSDLNSPEECFAKAFSNAHLEKCKVQSSNSNKSSLFFREFPIQNLGIADLVTFSLSSNAPKTIRAFEFKIDNWKDGLRQANRYKYYAEASILVMPIKNLKNVSKHINSFKELLVGIWLFNEKTKKIIKLYTPRNKKPNFDTYREKAINKLDTINESLLLS